MPAALGLRKGGMLKQVVCEATCWGPKSVQPCCCTAGHAGCSARQDGGVEHVACQSPTVSALLPLSLPLQIMAARKRRERQAKFLYTKPLTPEAGKPVTIYYNPTQTQLNGRRVFFPPCAAKSNKEPPQRQAITGRPLPPGRTAAVAARLV